MSEGKESDNLFQVKVQVLVPECSSPAVFRMKVVLASCGIFKLFIARNDWKLLYGQHSHFQYQIGATFASQLSLH